MVPIPMGNKSPEMVASIESMFPGTKAAIAAHKCPMCKHLVGTFKDHISEKEYLISGLCQHCQDLTFNLGEED